MRTKLYILLISFLNSKLFNRIMIKFTNSKISKYFIPYFIKKYKIKLDEIPKDLKSYESINDFFTRSINPDLRPIDEASKVITSPCDGVLSHVGAINDNTFIIKSKPYSIGELLDKDSCIEVNEGVYGLIYLSPSNYHRFHAITKCEILESYSRGHNSEPVNDMGLKYGNKPIVKNYRVIQKLKDENDNIFYIVYIGAVNVNSIVIHDKKKLEKGEEVGYFQFGSSILLLLPKSMAKFTRSENEKILFGQKLLEYY